MHNVEQNLDKSISKNLKNMSSALRYYEFMMPYLKMIEIKRIVYIAVQPHMWSSTVI